MGPRSPPRISRLPPRRSGGVWGRPGLLFTRGVRLRSRPRPAATPGKRREVAAARFFLWFPPPLFPFLPSLFLLFPSPFSFLFSSAPQGRFFFGRGCRVGSRALPGVGSRVTALGEAPGVAPRKRLGPFTLATWRSVPPGSSRELPGVWPQRQVREVKPIRETTSGPARLQGRLRGGAPERRGPLHLGPPAFGLSAG